MPTTHKASQRIATGWTTHSGSIKKATLNNAPRYALLNGVFLPEARWPNDGTLIYNANGSNTHVSATQLGQAPTSLVGAKLRIHNQSWAYDTRVVKTHSGTQVTFDGISVNLGNHAWGFWFEGKLQFLTNAGEWFYDSATKTIYVHATDPTVIDFVTGDHALALGYKQSDQKILDAEVKHGRQTGIYIDCGSNNHVDHCKVSDAFQGIKIAHNPGQVVTTGNSITDTEIFTCLDAAINCMGDYTLITGNHIHDIALKAGLAQDTWGGIAVNQPAGNGVRIAYNKVERVGYIGMGVTGNTIVHNNIFRDTCKVMNDGGAVATENSDGLRVLDNTFLAGASVTFAACPITYHGCAPRRKGLYKGEKTNKKLTAIGNVFVGYEGPAIFLDNSMDSELDEVAYNVIVDCRTAIGHSDWGNRNQPKVNNSWAKLKYTHNVHHNVVFCKDGDLLSHHINAHAADVDYGTSDFNVFYTNNPKPFYRENKTTGQVQHYSLKEWQDLTGRELNSVLKPYVKPEVITNDTMNEMIVTLPTPMQNVKNGAILQGDVKMAAMTSLVLLPSTNTPTDPPSTDYSTDQRKFSDLTVSEVVKVIQFANK